MTSIDVRPLPTCQFLQLRPRRNEEKLSLKALLFEIEAEDNDENEREEYRQEFSRLCGKYFFIPWCSKLDEHCVMTESVAIAEGSGPIRLLALNASRISECEDRNPKGRDFVLFPEWFRDHLSLE